MSLRAQMRSKLILTLTAVVAIGLISSFGACSRRRNKASLNAGKEATSDKAVAGAENRPAEFLLSSKDDEGYDLPEREEIREKVKLTSGKAVFVVGGDRDIRADTALTQVLVFSVPGKVKVETADTDSVEVLVVRSARARKDFERQKVKIDKDEGLFIRLLRDRESGPVPEIRQRVAIRAPRKAGVEIREIGGDVSIGKIDGYMSVFQVDGNVRAERASAAVFVVDVIGSLGMTFAPLSGYNVRIMRVNGDVDLRFEGEMNANLNASNVNGAIKLDFPGVETRKFEPEAGKFEGRIGKGGAYLEINRVNGNLNLSKATN
jgi:hypothetical protein